MLGMRHFYHVSPSGSTPHRSSLGYAHPPPSPWSQGDFTKPENEKSYTIELLKHELGGSDEDICHRLRTDFAVMYACGLREYQAPRSQVHFVLPETLCEFRSRIDAALMDELIAIQAAAAMEEGLVSPAHLVIDTFPCEQGSQRVTDATTLYKAQKKPSR
jgi:hypothetical protein